MPRFQSRYFQSETNVYADVFITNVSKTSVHSDWILAVSDLARDGGGRLQPPLQPLTKVVNMDSYYT